ncbi:hypothetical protein CSO86_003914 [Salmonella enterica subsp. diarizonae]|nr:hypothetical protein [Salmonella enterica]ECC9428201.1 hypothetical protein [Salmonella enterica subsp. diarizonae]ECI5696042.1 hypothetical protein [Salmonella enterica subsp. diarizonae]EDS0076217.1 hypothetical protein [Salmonella enterica subsp. diarizonae]EDV3465432.1 hypothetical protein [Salmonella enterica subsp. diarizonae]
MNSQDGHMGISVGHSYFTATISSETINKMFSSDELPHMTIWECIKDFFFDTGQREALNCLHKLCNPTPDLKDTDITSCFFRLKELASPGYQERFIHDFAEESSTGSLYLKDNYGDVFLYIEMSEGLCNYTILGKTFIFNTSQMPHSQQECETSTPNLSIIFQESESQSSSDSILWLKDGCYLASYGTGEFNLDFNEFYQSVLNFITSVQKGDNFRLWQNEEKETYISAMVNKAIDIHSGEKQVKLSKQVKEGVFEHVKNNLGVCDLRLNSSCAQSSIKHCVLTLLNKDKVWGSFINQTSTDGEVKKTITTDMVSIVSNQIFGKMFGDEMKLPEKWSSIVCSLVRDSIKLMSEPSDFIMQ